MCALTRVCAAVAAHAGRVFLISTVLGGRVTLGLAVGSAGTQLRHVEEAWEVVQAAAGRVLLGAEGGGAANGAA